VEYKIRYAILRNENSEAMLDDFMALPASGLRESQILGGTRLLGIVVLARIWVRIFFLVEVAKRVVDLTMFALIRTDCGELVVSM
jgi:hypothetical protein